MLFLLALFFIFFELYDATQVTVSTSDISKNYFSKNDNAVLAVNIYNGTDEPIRTAFYGVKVDEFSQIEVLGGFFSFHFFVSSL